MYNHFVFKSRYKVALSLDTARVYYEESNNIFYLKLVNILGFVIGVLFCSYHRLHNLIRSMHQKYEILFSIKNIYLSSYVITYFSGSMEPTMVTSLWFAGKLVCYIA